jgi:hypothetical protein
MKTCWKLSAGHCRIHPTQRVTPAMEAGIADHVWSLEEVVALIH